ncbi:MAG: HAMP domain-containing histidine kinase [Lachnospiraceae bacterium]|nr:HAMP domain-containing histidine kinase [Lachnospiraceae bacterium]
MNELRRKTILTLFSILTVILITALAALNINIYRREYMSIERGLNVFDNRGGFKDAPPGPDGTSGEAKKQKPRDIDNMMIADNEIYTVKLDTDGEISGIINHGSVSGNFDINKTAVTVRDRVYGSAAGIIHIGNLYHESYSYKYRNNDLIVILNNTEKSDKLKFLLIGSVIFFAIMEAVLFLVSRLITGRIVRPAEDAFKRQKEFIADASHELKTPLAVIMASADELRDDAAPGTNKQYIENIRYESDRMNRLITGLLDLSKLEESGADTSYKEEDLSHILEKTCLVFDGVAFEHSVTIQTDIEKNLMFKCNKDDMEKMFSTILDNAVKHSHKDTAVRVSAHLIKTGIEIKITDTGDPIKDEDRDRIFERFYRADRSRDRSNNRYGLGLAIAKRIALNHNGDIKAGSADGDTTFEIVFRK